MCNLAQHSTWNMSALYGKKNFLDHWVKEFKHRHAAMCRGLLVIKAHKNQKQFTPHGLTANSDSSGAAVPQFCTDKCESCQISHLAVLCFRSPSKQNSATLHARWACSGRFIWTPVCVFIHRCLTHPRYSLTCLSVRTSTAITLLSNTASSKYPPQWHWWDKQAQIRLTHSLM